MAVVKAVVKKEAEAAPAPEPVMYTEAEVEAREDLMQKLMTIDHIKSVLVERKDPQHFIKDLDDLREMVGNMLRNFLAYKQQQSVGNVEQQPAEPDEGDGGQDGQDPQ